MIVLKRRRSTSSFWICTGRRLQLNGLATAACAAGMIITRGTLHSHPCRQSTAGRSQNADGVHPKPEAESPALFEARVPRGSTLTRDEALAELTRRYFTSRGPATVRDYVWWSGLTVRDARAGIEMAGSTLMQEVIDGRPYWFAPSRMPARRAAPSVYLLPNYDELGIAYKDRDVVPSVPRPRRIASGGEFAHSW